MDLNIVPGRIPRTLTYGFLTAGFFASVRDQRLELDAASKSKRVPRDAQQFRNLFLHRRKFSNFNDKSEYAKVFNSAFVISPQEL